MPLVKSIGLPLPEFDPFRMNAKPRPELRTRDFFSVELLLVPSDPLIERGWRFQRLALPRSPGANLTETLAGSEVSIGFLIRNFRHRSLDSDLNVDGRPVEAKRRLGMQKEVAALSALVIGVKDETALVEPLKQHDSHRRLPAFFDGA